MFLNILADICDPGWSYFNGYCYFTSNKCANWTTALKNCRREKSVLVDVNSNEENVYLQHRHNGEKSWLGLNDISSEGSFTWADRGAGNFTAWAKNQPNNLGNEDCAHALGVKQNYEWNDVPCADCHQYTCKKGKVRNFYKVKIAGNIGNTHKQVNSVYKPSALIRPCRLISVYVLYLT